MTAMPPGPKSFFENVRYLKDPYATYLDATQRYGDPFTFPGLLGPIVVTGDPDGARAIFTADPNTFRPYGSEFVEPILGSDSMMLAAGAQHKRQRRLAMPAFHGERLASYGQMMVDAVMRALAGAQFPKPVVAKELARTISMDVLLRAMFGLKQPHEVIEFCQAVRETVDALGVLLLVFPALRRDFGGFGPWAKFKRKLERLNTLIYKQIELHRQGHGDPNDMLSMLLVARTREGEGISEKELRDELLSLAIAGDDTTSTSIAWVMYWVHWTPGVLDRVLADLDALGPDPEPKAIAALPYLHAVVSESMRLYPAVADVVRRLTRPFEFKGYTLPEGMAISVSSALVHMREDLYPDPLSFRPERFLERTFTPYEFVAFGGGVRRCIGMAFALYELKIVVGTLLGRYRFRLAGKTPVVPVRLGMTTGPSQGVQMILEGRRTPPTRPVQSSG